MSSLAIGIDFDATDRSIARATGSAEIDRLTEKPLAIDEYLAAETKGRLVQSLKPFLS